MSKLLNIGFGNYVPVNVVISITTPDSAPIKRKIDEAKKSGMLIDATFGRRTRSVIITNSNHIVLSAIQTDTIAKRFDKDHTIISEQEE